MGRGVPSDPLALNHNSSKGAKDMLPEALFVAAVVGMAAWLIRKRQAQERTNAAVRLRLRQLCARMEEELREAPRKISAA